MVCEAQRAVEELAKKNISAEVINMSSIKPLDGEGLLRSVKKTGCLVSCEEHGVYGGLGGAVAEYLMEQYPIPQEFIAVKDRFGQSGTPSELMVEYNLSYDNIVKAAEKAINRK